VAVNRIFTSAIVLCPGCDEPMKPVVEKPVLSTDLTEVTYRCGKCQTTTVRLIRADAVDEGSDAE
jgi:hypothetical protein